MNFTYIFLLSVVISNEWPLRFQSYSANKPAPGKQNPKGEDAYFNNDILLVVADGVGGWARHGIDSSLYSNLLVRNCSLIFERN